MRDQDVNSTSPSPAVDFKKKLKQTTTDQSYGFFNDIIFQITRGTLSI
jgi:hypothetical protein